MGSSQSTKAGKKPEAKQAVGGVGSLHFDTEALYEHTTADATMESATDPAQDQEDEFSEMNRLQITVSNLEQAIHNKDDEIDQLHKKLKDLRMQKDKQVEVLKETIEKVIKDKDSELRRLKAMWGMRDERQGIIPNYGETTPQGKKRFGISAENIASKNVRKSGDSPKTDAEKTVIRRAFGKNIFLSNLARVQVEELIQYMKKERRKANDVIIKEGDYGTDLYVIQQGQVEVVKERDNAHLASLAAGCVFGELAILYNSKRTASVRAKTDVTLWSVDRISFQSIVQRAGQKIRKEYFNLLKQVHQFHNIPDEKIARIADCLEEESFKTGEYIIRQGEVGDTFYIVNEGKVNITKNGKWKKSNEEHLTYVEKGGFFGERALLRDEKRAANVIAYTDVICLTMDRQAFNSLIGEISMEQTTAEKEHVKGQKDKHLSSNAHDEAMHSKDDDVDDLSNQEKAIVMSTPLHQIKVIKLIGKGGFGSVNLVSIKGVRDRPLALKKVRKAFITKMGQERHVVDERKLLMSMSSPFICRLHRTYKDDYAVYMLMDAYLGGDVYFYLTHRGIFPDESARFAVACVVEALGYLHCRGIAYRDLKPENLMINEKGYVKMIDFGFAKKMERGDKTWTFCGTPEYFPPEILQNLGHDYSADYWSLGILTFELLSRTTPFYAHDDMTVYEKIVEGIERIKFPSVISKNAELLIRNLCKLDPQSRLGNTAGGVNEIRKHRWYRGFHWEGLRSHSLKSPIEVNVANPNDTSNFTNVAGDKEVDVIVETSGWDADF